MPSKDPRLEHNRVSIALASARRAPGPPSHRVRHGHFLPHFPPAPRVHIPSLTSRASSPDDNRSSQTDVTGQLRAEAVGNLLDANKTSPAHGLGCPVASRPTTKRALPGKMS